MSSAEEDAKKRIRLGIKVTVIILVVGGLLFAVDKGFDIGIYSAIGSGIGSISTGGGGGGGVSGGAGGGGDGGAGGLYEGTEHDGIWSSETGQESIQAAGTPDLLHHRQ